MMAGTSEDIKYIPVHLICGSMSREGRENILALNAVTETWAIMKPQMKALRSTQRAMERSILKIKKKDRVRNELVRKNSALRASPGWLCPLHPLFYFHF